MQRFPFLSWNWIKRAEKLSTRLTYQVLENNCETFIFTSQISFYLYTFFSARLAASRSSLALDATVVNRQSINDFQTIPFFNETVFRFAIVNYNAVLYNLRFFSSSLPRSVWLFKIHRDVSSTFLLENFIINCTRVFTNVQSYAKEFLDR